MNTNLKMCIGAFVLIGTLTGLHLWDKWMMRQKSKRRRRKRPFFEM